MIEVSDTELAARYRWFCTVGYKNPVLNDPKIIHDAASPEYVDHLITKGMKRWPLNKAPVVPPTPGPMVA